MKQERRRGKWEGEQVNKNEWGGDLIKTERGEKNLGALETSG